MQQFIQAVILGFVQGATEFIPVSSSGHLVIVPWLFGWPKPDLLFDTMLHWGTLLAIVLVFWRDFLTIIVAVVQSVLHRTLQNPDARLGWFLVIGTIPAALTGLLLKDFVESLFASPLAVGFFLLVTAALLAGSEILMRRRQATSLLNDLRLPAVIAIGCAQAIALAPGISRSGSTIAAGLATGLRRDEAARFSFLLGTPAFLGAGLLQLTDALAVDPAQVAGTVPYLVTGFIVSAFVGYIAIRFLLQYLRTHTLTIFAVYCTVVGMGVIFLATITA